jgi:hypothetical protein
MIHELEELRRQNAELREENARLRGACDAGLTKSGGASSDPAEREDLILESATGFAIFSMGTNGLITSWNEGAGSSMAGARTRYWADTPA